MGEVADFNHFADNELIGPPIVLIVAGAIVFIIAFLGCFGAIREKRSLLIAVRKNCKKKQLTKLSNFLLNSSPYFCSLFS